MEIVLWNMKLMQGDYNTKTCMQQCVLKLHCYHMIQLLYYGNSTWCQKRDLSQYRFLHGNWDYETATFEKQPLLDCEICGNLQVQLLFRPQFSFVWPHAHAELLDVLTRCIISLSLLDFQQSFTCDR